MPRYKVEGDILAFKKKALRYATSNFEHVCLLEGNNQPYLHGAFPVLLTFGTKRKLEVLSGSNSFDQLKAFQENAISPIFGFLTYDLKNDLEMLKSENTDELKIQDLFFFEPLYILEFLGQEVTIDGENSKVIFDRINETTIEFHFSQLSIKNRISQSDYISKVEGIQKHIQRGDIYELNFCQEFYAENVDIEPVSLFFALNEISPMPFSSFIKVEEKYLICASPERFLKKEGRKIISQPIKGTARRGHTEKEDFDLKLSLSKSEKELSEHVMIVDLVRNDLSKSAKDGSVHVEELFGIYSFSNVHQMVSTVVAELGEGFQGIDALKLAFPMGSMTGAPKFRAMELIEEFEETKRGLFSGSMGYIQPNGDFDFNVVIRSILYNSTSKYLSFQVGSAITMDADALKEWEECEVKISAIKKALNIVY